MPKALLIEDELLLSEAFAEILQMETDFDIEIFNDGQAAADRLQGDVADVVFLDLHLPKVSGLDILNQIRADDRWAKTQVIVMTADHLGAQKASTADHVLMKPIDLDDILNIVSKLDLPE
jgi:DNA-binding response OmpR family regulator